MTISRFLVRTWARDEGPGDVSGDPAPPVLLWENGGARWRSRNSRMAAERR